jgi:hypothetical protein
MPRSLTLLPLRLCLYLRLCRPCRLPFVPPESIAAPVYSRPNHTVELRKSAQWVQIYVSTLQNVRLGTEGRTRKVLNNNF